MPALRIRARDEVLAHYDNRIDFVLRARVRARRRPICGMRDRHYLNSEQWLRRS